MKKLNIAVIFGGTNTEHEVSLVSARSIIQNLNPEKYQVLPVLITKDNKWLMPKGYLTHPQNLQALPETSNNNLTAHPQEIVSVYQLDLFFPVIHGPLGEDGTLQGLLELIQVPYVGCGVLGSAVCMDKDIQKRICREAGIPVVPYQVLKPGQKPRRITYPCFVKPANQGSSIGVTKVHQAAELNQALKHAFSLDTKVLVETAIIKPREIECSILGTTAKPKASVLGEIISSNEFYDYDAKYVDNKSKSIIPAKLNARLTHAIQTTAKKAFTVTECYGLARVDFLIDRVGEYYLNEINTLPGFTKISMYPKLWSKSGISYSKLLDELINLAQKRFQTKSHLTTSYTPKNDWFKK